MRFVQLSICTAALLATCTLAEPASASGYWNMPSTLCQGMNVGWGAGYHAPLVLGPISWDGWIAPNEIRLPYSPAPCYGYYGDFGCQSGPSRLEASVVPQPVASPVHGAPVNGIFAPPIER